MSDPIAEQRRAMRDERRAISQRHVAPRTSQLAMSSQQSLMLTHHGLKAGPGTLYSLYSLDIAIDMITYANPQSLNRAGPTYEIL